MPGDKARQRRHGVDESFKLLLLLRFCLKARWKSHNPLPKKPPASCSSKIPGQHPEPICWGWFMLALGRLKGRGQRNESYAAQATHSTREEMETQRSYPIGFITGEGGGGVAWMYQFLCGSARGSGPLLAAQIETTGSSG